MQYQGSCHCGKIAFTVEGEIGSVVECNCSHCRRKGYLLWFVPQEAFHLTTSAADIETYTFNRHVIKHHFCDACGCAPFAEGKDAEGKPTASINVRCLEGVEPSSLKITQFDGRSK
ncbi:MAG: GFA family protein [Pseudomonadota bacterium]|nr:GFA family protein [Pseudomonadota bacterium]